MAELLSWFSERLQEQESLVNPVPRARLLALERVNLDPLVLLNRLSELTHSERGALVVNGDRGAPSRPRRVAHSGGVGGVETRPAAALHGYARLGRRRAADSAVCC
jgi:hypothetical protein